MSKLRSPIKCHGGKYYLAKWIIKHFPDNYQEMRYIEPFCGGSNVLLQKKPSREEIINDIDPGVVAIFKMIRDMPKVLYYHLNKTPYEEVVFQEAVQKDKEKNFKSELDQSINEIILRRMSRGGLRKAFAWSNRLRGGQPGDVNAWKTFVNQIPQISERLKKVKIYNEFAEKLIQQFGDEETLIYCDPTYMPQTRQAKNVYANEMKEKDHEELSRILNESKAKIIISGYPSPEYDEWFKEWNTEQKEVANHSSQQKIKQYKLETLWINH